jgi:lipoprotein-anchoring transpeptidase ErfK/SrfK
MHAGILPGYPASHGCIRLPEKVARVIFEKAKIGTPVMILE